MDKPIPMGYEVGGYATRNNLRCGDGRIILRDAFKDNNGQTVPLVWQHQHNSVDNVLGHAILENRTDGVYAYCYLNDGPQAESTRSALRNGDLNYLSIYANGLVQKGNAVMHGCIKEVSLVLSASNPGAVIDHLALSHSGEEDDDIVEVNEIIYTGFELEKKDMGALVHANEEKLTVKDVINTLTDIQKEAMRAVIAQIMEDDSEEAAKKSDDENLQHAANPEDQTVGDVFNTLTEIQKEAVYAIIAQILDDTNNDDSEVTHSNMGANVKHNVFADGNGINGMEDKVLHIGGEEMQKIWRDAEKSGSFRAAFLAHADVTYGAEHMDYMFPDATLLNKEPEIVKRQMEWVKIVLDGCDHPPFNRIKTVHADITAEEARAKGFVKGGTKTPAILKLLRRITTPWTVYHKGTLDRDDMIDITELDILAWYKGVMKIGLDEDLARAVLIGDGRATDSPDKINEECIRPIWTDDDAYTDKVQLAADLTPDEIIDEMSLAREYYMGSGLPTMFTTTSFLTRMLLTKGSDGHRLYANQKDLEATLRVKAIVEVPLMANLTRVNDEEETVKLIAILVNLADYSIGSNKGGSVGWFDDFDINLNQQLMLIETRVCGALTKMKGAQVFEQLVEEVVPPVGG